MQKLIHTAILCLTLAGCNNISGQNASNEDSKVVARVGNLKVTEDMVKMRSEMYQNDPTIRDLEITATAQLLHGLLAANIAAQHGHPVTDGSVEKFWNNTKHLVPEKLVELELKTKDKEFFYRVMVLPELASLVTQHIYANTDAANKEKIDQTQRLHTQLLHQPEAFERVALEELLTVDRRWVSSDGFLTEITKKGKVSTAPADAADVRDKPTIGFSEAEQEVAREIYRQLGETPAGQVLSLPIHAPDAFKIVKVEKRLPDRAKVTLISIEKRTYDEWFWKSAAAFEVDFSDLKRGERLLRVAPLGKKLTVRKDLYPSLFPKP